MSNLVRELWLVVAFLAAASSGCGASPGPPPVTPASVSEAAPAPIVNAPALLLDLPRANEWSPLQALLVIDMSANGEIYIDGRSTEQDADLLERMRVANARHPGVRAVVRADTTVSHGRVIHTLDLLMQAGIEKIAFGVTPVGASATSKRSASAPRGGSTVQLRSGQGWACAFPPAADAERIDKATVTLVVAVDASGEPRWIRVLEDPGYGFGQAATLCALANQYEPAHDEKGAPIHAISPPIRVRFER